MKLHITAANGEYDILFCSSLPVAEITGAYNNYVVITDQTVFDLYGHHFNADKTIVLQPGEATKSFSNLQMILDRLVEMQIDRQDAVIALGGGVVGDIAGFAASIYKRGVPFIQIPTTLVAQVDSSVGGKVAVNLNGGKNMAGAFYQPKAVYTDLGMLETLPEREFASGMAEVIKYAYIADKSLYIWLCEGNMPLNRIVYECCEIKKRYVEADPYDTGARMQLNYGHTIGHALEAAAGYGTLLHGEAVAMGMVYAAFIGERLGISPHGLADDTKTLVNRYQLPYEADRELLERAFVHLSADKKAVGDKIQFVLLNSVGQADVYPVSEKEIEQILLNTK